MHSSICNRDECCISIYFSSSLLLNHHTKTLYDHPHQLWTNILGRHKRATHTGLDEPITPGAPHVDVPHSHFPPASLVHCLASALALVSHCMRSVHAAFPRVFEPCFDADVGLVHEIARVHSDMGSGDGLHQAGSVRPSHLSDMTSKPARTSWGHPREHRGKLVSWRMYSRRDCDYDFGPRWLTSLRERCDIQASPPHFWLGGCSFLQRPVFILERGRSEFVTSPPMALYRSFWCTRTVRHGE